MTAFREALTGVLAAQPATESPVAGA
jgi:hypothetical protein